MRVAVVVALCAASSASADVRSDDVAKAATALFEQGRQLLDAGKQDAACDKFEASLRLDPQIGTKLNVAACLESKGHLIEAYRMFEDCAREDVKTPGKETRLDFERQRMAKLVPKLVRVKLNVTAPGVAGVLLDKRTVEPTGEHVVAPGPVVVTIAAPGRDAIRVERTGVAGGEIVVELAELPPIASEPVHIPIGETGPPRTQRRAWIAGGIGVTCWAISFSLGLHAKLRSNDAVDTGDANKSRSAFREADAGTAFFAAGAVAVVVGAYFYIHDRKAAVVPTATAGGAGISVAGAF